jgi:hypothetical protein
MAHKPQDIVIRVGVGEVYSMMVAEGTAWNPDVAKDMVNRIDELWRNTIESAVDAGLIDTSPLPRDAMTMTMTSCQTLTIFSQIGRWIDAKRRTTSSQ